MKLSNAEISSMRTMGELREGRGDDLLARKNYITPKCVSIEIETKTHLNYKKTKGFTILTSTETLLFNPRILYVLY